MSFVKKTPSEFEALSEYQKEKYLDDLSKENARIVQEAADKSIAKAIEEMKSELKTEREAEKLVSDEALAKITALAEKNGTDLEEALKALNRAKVGEVGERIKGVSDLIIEKLSTPEGELLLKNFFKGQKFEMEVSEKAMLKPTGGVAPQFTAIVGPGHDDFHARDVIPVFPTVSDVIKFIEFTVDPAAAGFGYVPEGGQKPDLGYISTVKSAIVQKIAGLLDFSNEMADDVVGFRAWLAYELPKAYLDMEDYEIFKGVGGQDAILGLWEQADFQTLPLGSVTSASNPIDKIMAGITEIRILKRPTSAVFVSPVEWMEILINKSTTEEYTYPIVLRADGVMTIGGIPIYWSNVFLQGEGLVGSFSRGCAIFQRKGMEIAYSDEHKDNFGKNIITARLEGRIALTINWPEAFKRLFTPGS